MNPASIAAPAGEAAADEPLLLARETASYLTNTARSTTLANLLAPLLCAYLFREDAVAWKLNAWLAYMAVATVIRTWLANRLETDPARIADPHRNLLTTTWCVGLIGVGWGLGWLLLAPDLDLVNRMFYMFITTGAMFAGMFGWGVHWPAFYALCIPIFVPAIASAFWPQHGFPWPFSVGLLCLFIYVLSISRKFSRTYKDSIRLRLRNDALYQELAGERDAQVAANVAKSRFIASASHDLRQPMHAVNLYLEALDPQRLPEPERGVVGRIRSSVGNLNQMFESLLDVSKLDAFTWHAEAKPFRLDTLVASLEAVGAPLAAGQGIGFRVEGPDAWLVGDMRLLRQVLLNLITNAIYYTQQGSVDVRLRAQQGLLVAEVADTGCGIAQADQALVFTEFYRVSETRSRHDGLGLGLSIVRRLCDLVGARIELESEVGRGSVFRVFTPYALSMQAPAQEGLPRPAAPAADAVSLAGRTIAVVEDDANIVEAYRQALGQRGARVVTLPEERQALQRELAELDAIDFIISDYRLQGTSGDRVIQQLREAFNQDIPALIVTADTSPGHIHLFAALGVPVLHKPIPFQRVMDKVEAMLGTREG